MSGDDKRTKVEIEAIVNQICYMMVCGITRRSDIFQNISKMDALPKNEQLQRGWVTVGDKSDRMIDMYVKRAREEFLQYNAESREETRALYLAQLEELYKKAVKDGKIQTANNIMKNKIYLQGMGGFSVTGNFNASLFDVKLTPEQYAAYKDRMTGMYGDKGTNLKDLDIDTKDI